MNTYNFITVRLGKDSITDINRLCDSHTGVLHDTFRINVKCTQIPDDYNAGDYAFIWLGSDNNKGMSTKWKQGFKAVGKVQRINRGNKYNDMSETEIEVVYIFGDSVNRMDILRCAPVAYYWCSAMPLIGIDDHANQTIRCMQGNSFGDIRAFFCAIDKVDFSFKEDIISVERGFASFFDLTLPTPQDYPNAKSIIETGYKEDNARKHITGLQQIFYGAPGTGKSYHVKEVMARAANVRTTFHPDSDYSTFVGAYKPTMKRVELRDLAGHVVKDDNTKQTLTEEQIVYQFVPQAFLKAYVGAWRNLDEPFYLVIEEINRGNCAQVFGDLFQLLDREADGYSSYPIDADDDIRRYLGEVAFADLTDEQREAIGREDIVTGERLLLPPNLHIWATMNTSDQSLFPIDSAFKRRWDWTYLPISDAGKGWKIACGKNCYDWWQFLEAVNDKVGKTTDSEDKKLGYFFVQAVAGGEISAERFVGKVVFYLWNDVFKDYGFDDQVFAAADGGRLTFQKFFQADGTPDLSAVERFLTNLGLQSETETTDEEEAQ